MSLFSKKPASIKVGVLSQLLGVTCFFLIVPFGITFGVVLRLFGGTHRDRAINTVRIIGR